jgi:hypothetical protein
MVQSALARMPSVAIVAPPRGDPLAIGLRGRGELEAALSALTPSVVLSVGNSTLQASIAELGPVRSGLSFHVHVRGTLGEAGVDLRALLLDSIRAWAALDRSVP